jgi:hypothetical protein
MTGQLRTTALVAATLGGATVLVLAVAMLSTMAATVQRTVPKVEDRLDAETGPARRVEIRDINGTLVYLHDPRGGETVLAKGFPGPRGGVPIPRPRRSLTADAGRIGLPG